MLEELAIQNFAIIPQLTLSFSPGMTVLTGETGAGKSIIIDAMSLLVGGRGSVDYVREGSNKAVLQAQFSLTGNPLLQHKLIQDSLESSEETLIIQRELSANGKNVCRINGHLVNTATLREIGSYLVDIHGQNEHQSLLKADHHLALLDQYGGQPISEALATYQEKFQAYEKTKQLVAQKNKHEKAFAQRLDMLRFQCEDIENAGLVVGEEAELLSERTRLLNYQKIVEALTTSYAFIQSGDLNSLDNIGQAATRLEEIAALDAHYATIAEGVNSAYYQLQDSVTELGTAIDHLELDEERLGFVEQRLAVIREMKRKYGEDEAAVLHYFAEISQELAESSQLEVKGEALHAQLEEQATAARQAAKVLSQLRQEVAQQLALEIVQELQELYMEHTVFEAKFAKINENHLTATGIDDVEFYLSTNVGEPLKPLVKVISGGELSRVMLAIKTIFSKNQALTTLVFDEVDTGVSGRVAQAIGNKIYQIGTSAQVLCITHLPQVAAMADHHYHIEKEVHHKRTETLVYELTDSERITEIAHMLAGEALTEVSREHAEELLQSAKKEKS